jgi:hypothetical protein
MLMLATKPHPYITEPLQCGRAAEWGLAPPVLHGSQAAARIWHAWRAILKTLHDWAQDPATLEDEGLDAPARETIRAAISLAEWCQREGTPPPDQVLCDPNGGIVFRRHEGENSEELHLSEDGLEYRVFDGTRVVERRRI